MDKTRIEQRNPFLNFIQRHIREMVWLILYLIMIFIASRHQNWLGTIINASVTILPMMSLSWVLHKLLLPRMLHKNRVAFITTLLLFICVLVVFATISDVMIYRVFRDLNVISRPADLPKEGVPIGRALLLVKYTFLLLSTAMVVTISHMIDERKQQLSDFHEQQMQEQLKYLRAQINPHFLFNALNCIYSLTMLQDEKAPDSVLKLSEMLRYVIDDCRSDEVLLTKEIKYIQNYIDFQRIRMEQDPDLTFDVQVTDPNYKIPPMILQPIIENCFKHSRLVDDPQAWAHISVRQNDSGLLFTCDNSKPKANNFSRQSAIAGRKDEERTGIGLMNVQQRLDVLFGSKCSLKVIEDENHYKTILHI